MKDAFEAAAQLRRCCKARDLTTGRRLHADLSRIGLDAETVVGNLLVQLYGACGCINEALDAYHRIWQRNVFSDNILMTGLAQNGRAVEARSLFFGGMKQRNEVSWTILMSISAQDGDLAGAAEVFHRMPMTSAFSCNSMVSVCAQNGRPDDGWMLFTSMAYRDVSCWNAVVKMFCRARRVTEAEMVYNRMPSWDVVASTDLLVAFTQAGHLEKSEKLFGSMPERSVISWNAMMAAYASQGCTDHVWEVFLDMVQRSASSWNTLLQAVSRQGDQQAAVSVFDKMPMHDDVSLVAACEVTADRVLLLPDHHHLSSISSWNVLLRAYSRAGESEQVRLLFTLMPYRDTISFTTVLSTLAYDDGCLSEAVTLFRTMPSRDLISWSAHIAVYAQHGEIDSARELFDRMPSWDVVSWNAVLAAYFLRCSADDLQAVKNIFASMLQREESTWNLVVGGYARSGKLGEARDLFDKSPCSDVFQWNALMHGYVEAGSNHLAWELFERMPEPSPSSYTIVLPMCTGSKHLELLGRLDVEGTAAGDFSAYAAFLDSFGSSLSSREKQAAMLISEVLAYHDDGEEDRTWAALLSMFGRCSHLDEARRVFDGRGRPSTLLWTALLMAYSQNGCTQEVLWCFRTMMLSGRKPDKVTLIAVLDACTVDCRDSEVALRLAATELGMDETTDSMLGNSLVVMYGRWGQPYKAKKIFDRMPESGTVPWTSMIAAYSRSGHMLLAMTTFAQMDLVGVPADNVTFAAALEACTTLVQGKAVHEELSILPSSSCSSSALLTALVCMYARCGSARAARMAFDDARVKAPASGIAWTALVSANAQNGHIDEALTCFQQMQSEGLELEGVTFLSILAACSHAGVVKHGLDAFLSMQSDHGLRPSLEHYLCMVDLLCRAGNLEQAEALLDTMPYEPQSLGWMTLLAACKSLGCVDRGQRAASQVLQQDTKSSAYVLLSGIHATASSRF